MSFGRPTPHWKVHHIAASGSGYGASFAAIDTVTDHAWESFRLRPSTERPLHDPLASVTGCAASLGYRLRRFDN